MDRLACISIPALALQTALKRFPPGYQEPLVLVKEDRPLSLVQHVNRAARDQGLRPGMRYSQALTIVREVKAAVVTPDDLDAARRGLVETLGRWSPTVEPCPFDPAVFWLDARGLSGLYGTERQWGSAVRAALKELRYQAVVAVGLTRGGTYVVAQSRRSAVIRSAEAERRAFEAAPLSLFPLAPKHRRLLGQLQLTTLSGVLKIPAEELARRFGPELMKDLRRLEVLSRLPLQSERTAAPLFRSRRLDPPVSDRQQLGALLEAPLKEGMGELVKGARLLAELRLVLVLESRDRLSETLRPAEPTSQASSVLKLLRLRVDHIALSAPVLELRLGFESVPQPPATGELFEMAPVRDLKKGLEVLALLRARWGNDSVVRAVAADQHLPGKAFHWQQIDRLRPPEPPVPQSAQTAVRRIRRKAGGGNPSGQRLGGPQRLRLVSGPDLVDREYWFLRTGRGEVAWVSYDLTTRQPAWEGMAD